jgi:prevent-host-death family protein
MSERSPGRKKRKPSIVPESGGSYVAAAEFKATCLELMDKVKATGSEYVITKHGKPVAKLVPVDAPKKRGIFGSMKGTVLKYDRPFDPIDGEWDVNR